MEQFHSCEPDQRQTNYEWTADSCGNLRDGDQLHVLVSRLSYLRRTFNRDFNNSTLKSLNALSVAESPMRLLLSRFRMDALKLKLQNRTSDLLGKLNEVVIFTALVEAADNYPDRLARAIDFSESDHRQNPYADFDGAMVDDIAGAKILSCEVA